MHKALLLLSKIPKGKVTTYKILAKLLNTSPRAIGRIIANNPDPINCPCYKVVGSDGKLVGYSGKGGLKSKTKLLEKDGIKIVDGKVSTEYFYYFNLRKLH